MLSKNSSLLSELNNSLKSYNLGKKGLDTQDPRGIFQVKNKILKFCELVRNLLEKSFKISRHSLSDSQNYGFYKDFTSKYGKLSKIFKKSNFLY